MKMHCSTGNNKVEVIKGTEEALGQIEAEKMVGIDAEVEEMSVVGLMIDELEDILKKLIINKILLAMMEVRFACQSTMHFVADCPHRKDYEESPVNNVHITLLNSKPDLVKRNLVAETLGKGLLGSGCSKTVAGEVRLQEYLYTFPKETNVIEVKSNALFRFGDGGECRGLKCVTLPVTIGNYKCSLRVDIVPNDIPLLISKDTMKRLGMKIGFSDDSLTLHKKKIKLTCTKSGHNCIPIYLVNLEENSSSNIILHSMELVNRSTSEKMAKAKKLHRQFSHASKEKLRKLLINSKCDDK